MKIIPELYFKIHFVPLSKPTVSVKIRRFIHLVVGVDAYSKRVAYGFDVLFDVNRDKMMLVRCCVILRPRLSVVDLILVYFRKE